MYLNGLLLVGYVFCFLINKSNRAFEFEFEALFLPPPYREMSSKTVIDQITIQIDELYMVVTTIRSFIFMDQL